MQDFKTRDGRSVRASRFLRLIDAITRRRQLRPAAVLTFAPAVRFWPFGQQCLHDSALAAKRIDARGWLLRRGQQRRDRVRPQHKLPGGGARCWELE